MVVLVLERAPPGLRGELTRWLLEIRPGVFVGTVNALVRDYLWEKVCQQSKGNPAVLIYPMDTEQGFTFRLWGWPTYQPEEFEGLVLVRRPEERRGGEGEGVGGDSPGA
jgi:CRISPR-associated protein Cas2